MKKLLAALILFLILYPQITIAQEGYQSGDHETLIYPTAFTMQKGDLYLTSYELFFLNFTGAPTSTTHIGVFTLFPIVTSFLETASLGVKQRIPISDKFNVAGVLSYTPKAELVSFGAVATYGTRERHFNLGVLSFSTGLGDNDVFDKGTQYLVYFGSGIDISKRVTLLLEGSFFAQVENSFLLGFGFRFRYEDLSWEIGGIRPMSGDLGDLLLIPMLKANFVF